MRTSPIRSRRVLSDCIHSSSSHPHRVRSSRSHPDRVRSDRHRSGATLLELATSLLLLGMALSLLHPLSRRSADRMAVAGARERVVGLIDRARAEARAAGSSEIEIRGREAVAVLRRGGAVVGRVELGREGVTLDPGGSRDTVVVSFDALGLGRVASRTLAFRKGEAEASLVLSSLGRVTRR